VATDLNPIVDGVLKRFEGRQPTKAELKQHVVGLGIPEAAFILQALKIIWDLEQERKKRKAEDKNAGLATPTCTRRVRGKECGALIAHSEIEKDDLGARFLVQVCVKKHEIRLPLAKH
jgi:hypothetical protein